jgi:hypothetical protein
LALRSRFQTNMRLSPTVVLVLCLFASAALAPAAAAAKPAAKPCVARGSTTVAKSLQARVYERGGDEHELVGCNRLSGRRTVIARWSDCECSIADEPAPQVWLAGRHVAVNSYFCPPDQSPCSGGMAVVDLRTGRVRHRAKTGALIALVIKPNGSVAYVLGPQVIRIAPRGSALLDEGPGIDDGSLAVNRTRLYWLRNNQPQTASLR